MSKRHIINAESSFSFSFPLIFLNEMKQIKADELWLKHSLKAVAPQRL